jgi:acyl-CoA reductase-like NAD-dependent aldehyde dehydrogenase
MSCEKLRWVINNGERFLKREYRATGFNLHKQAYIDYVPYGVIGIIIPWNFPIHNALSHITTALMTGTPLHLHILIHDYTLLLIAT